MFLFQKVIDRSALRQGFQIPVEYHPLLSMLPNGIPVHGETRNIKIILDGKEYDAIGVGNVCVAKNKRGMNYGALLLHSVNTVIKERDSVGILLCKDALTGFYRKAGWNEIGKDVSITVAGKDFCNHAFIYNLSEMPVRQLQTDISF